VAVAEPIVIELADEAETQTFLEVREVASPARLVTVLEVLSPSNKKPGEAQAQYLRKQAELLQAGVSLVEIDLLRDGDWIVAVPLDAVEREIRANYRVVARRGWRPLHADYYPIRLADRLPCIKVPLRPDDADAPLDLQSLIEQCYADGGYDDIDYGRPPEPPLAPAEARWAAQLLRRRNGKRRK
jgi:hypothetical protein